MRTYRYLSKLDNSFSQHMRKLEFHIRQSNKEPSAWFNNMIMPYSIIQITNTWSSFIRNYYLSCALSTNSRAGSRVSSPVTSDMNQALGLVILHYKKNATPKADGSWHRRDEPAWHDFNTLLTGANLLSLTNQVDINAAFSTKYRVFKDLPVFRNFFAHKNSGTEQAARQLALQYGIPSTLRPSQILMRRAVRRPQELVFDWVDELVFTANYLCH